MSRTIVTFDGHELTQDYIASNYQTSLLPRNVETISVPGVDGELLTGRRLAPRTITLTLTATGTDVAQRQEAARRLAGWLNVSEPRPLAIGIDGGVYYLAVPTSENDATRYVNATSFEVAFLCPDPVGYGEETDLELSAPSSLSFEVGGNYPTMPVVASGGPVYITSDDALVRIALEDGTYLAYNPPYGGSGGSTEAHRFRFDCETRTLQDCVEQSGNLSWSTLPMLPDADWLVLTPGAHALSVDGCVDCDIDEVSVTFHERWL